MLGVACIFPIDEDADKAGVATDTEGDTEDSRGWLFQCENNGTDPNYNYRWQYANCDYDTDGVDTAIGGCWGAWDYPTGLDVCINAGNVDNFDPSNWEAFDAEIRGECSAVCVNEHELGGPGIDNVEEPDDPKCIDADWSDVFYSGGASPNPMGSDCDVSDYKQLELDPDGSEIEWPDESSAPTHCNLYDGECDADFDAVVYPWVSHLYQHEDIDIGTRRADYLAVSTTSTVTFNASTGQFVLPLDATVEYSTSSCVSDGCPFYLANVEATQTGGALAIEIPHEGDVLEKELSGFKVDLVHSAWGIQHQAQDWFVLTSGTLQLQVEFTLVNTDGDDTGDGTFKKVLVNDEEIFGTRDASGLFALSVQREFIPDVTATIDLDDANDVEEPPTVSDTLPATLKCGTFQTAVELSSYVSSSDPDGDVDIEGWLLDGAFLYGADVELGNGTYDIAAVAVDTRGALDMGPEKELKVSKCP